MRSLLLIISIMGLVLYKAETTGWHQQPNPPPIPPAVANLPLENKNSPGMHLFSTKAVDGVRISPGRRNPHPAATVLQQKVYFELLGTNTQAFLSFHLNATRYALPGILLANKN